MSNVVRSSKSDLFKISLCKVISASSSPLFLLSSSINILNITKIYIIVNIAAISICKKDTPAFFKQSLHKYNVNAIIPDDKSAITIMLFLLSILASLKHIFIPKAKIHLNVNANIIPTTRYLVPCKIIFNGD